MILNLSSLSFNTNILSGGGTPAWGTEMGQGEGYRFNFENVGDFMTGLVYNSIHDIENVSCPLGKGGQQSHDYEFVIASLFEKIFVNNKPVPNSRFLLLVVKKLFGANHIGRRTLKYNPKITYKDAYINQECFENIENVLGINKDSSWFINEINIVNQDELHFTAYILSDTTLVFNNIEQRRIAYLNKLKENNIETEFCKNDYYQTIYYGSPGSGKSYYVNRVLMGHKEHSYRVTFHPDSDYASFVGAYKPVITKEQASIRNDYTTDELAELLKEEYKNAPNKVAALHGFILKYIKYFNGEINRFNKKEFALKSGLAEDYHTEINKMVNLYDWMLKNNFLSKSSTISYKFVPQAFTNAYVDAWKNPDEQVFLVIEEINRGNCAQIFGDIFQLLDRDSRGDSLYFIKANTDLREFLEDTLGINHPGITNGELRIPGNLSILATMNTSDQSLFPMDSAFKRRWSWEYVPINADCPDSQFKITIGEKTYEWSSFLKKVNERIHSLSDSEDKQMGNFFIKSDIDVEEFKSKVMFYLWSEVCKEYEKTGSFFKDKNENDAEFTFNSLFPTNEETNKRLQGFMAYLSVEEI